MIQKIFEAGRANCGERREHAPNSYEGKLTDKWTKVDDKKKRERGRMAGKKKVPGRGGIVYQKVSWDYINKGPERVPREV